jgi:hypothetical protein
MTPEQATRRINAERRRQIDQEGWTPEHDDRHDNGEMLTAATLYFLNAKPSEYKGCKIYHLAIKKDGAPLGWPWTREWWKPKTPLRDLERAGALCLAEKDRLIRKGLHTHHVDYKSELIIKAMVELEP